MPSETGLILVFLGKLKCVHDNECILKEKKVEAHNVDPLDIGNFVGILHEFDDDTKLNVIQNHWISMAVVVLL